MDKIFGEEFQPKRMIDNPSDEQLRKWALEQGGTVTEFGNLSVITQVRNRIAKFTEVVMGEPEPGDIQLVRQVRRAIDPDWDLYDRLSETMEGLNREEVDARRQLELG